LETVNTFLKIDVAFNSNRYEELYNSIVS